MKKQPSILIYIMDSLRRDFLGCYGDQGAMTPHLDCFAQQATRFTNAYALAAWSKASGTALLTGELPRAVRMRGLLDGLPDGVPTLPEQLEAAGVWTGIVSANPFISHDFGLLRGFTAHIEAFRPGILPTERFFFHPNHFRRLADSLSVEASELVLARSEALHEALLAQLPTEGLPSNNVKGPFFALCWSMDTHAPFFVRGEESFFGNPLERVIPAADPEWLTNGLTVQDVVSLYRDMIAYNDAQFGRLVADLKQRQQWDDTLVIVAGDHGEAFGEHGLMGHSNGLWEEQISIPLLVKFPHQQGMRVCETPVSLMDVTATIAEMMGVSLECPSALSLSRILKGEGQTRSLLLENPTGWALRRGDWKLITHYEDQPPQLFNVRTDPQERRPLADRWLRDELVREAQRLQREADERAARWDGGDGGVDELVLVRLRHLGYL